MPPLVAGGTGSFMAMMNNAASTIAVICFNKLNLPYAAIVAIMAAIGSFTGVLNSFYLVKKTCRKSITVIILLFWLFVLLVGAPTVSIIVLMRKAADGFNAMTLTSFC